MSPVLEDLAGQILHAGQQGGILATLIVALVLLFNQEQRVSGRTLEGAPGHNLTVDFIVRGAGTAGTDVVADRLTEHPNWIVLLLEAGHDETVLSQVPLDTNQMWRPFADWNYTTTPQKNALLWNSTCYLPRGYLIGGCSVMNTDNNTIMNDFMKVMNDFVPVRGNRMDYNSWAASGIEHWAYSDCLPFFRRLENNRYMEGGLTGRNQTGFTLEDLHWRRGGRSAPTSDPH